jgi:hypothetical protein
MAMDENLWPSHKIYIQLHGHVMSFATDYLMALIQSN